jgi:hypothetical protein
LVEQGKQPIYQKPNTGYQGKKPYLGKKPDVDKGNQPNKPPYQPYPSHKGQKPLVDFGLQVYEPSKPKPKRTVDPSLYVPFGTTTPFYPPQYLMGDNAQQGMNDPRFQYQQGTWAPNQVPIIKNYNINVSGPTGNHGKINAIYEDILPSKEFLNTPTTLGERRNIYNFVRSIFIKQGDGEDIDLDESGSNSLLRYLKFMELNPYNANQISDNPYKGLPDGMLIYKSCYPIRYNKHDNNVECAKNSIGMNIRIYKMSVGEYSVRQHKQSNYYDFDMWREIAYYEYIREHIMKPNICPNFVMLFGYFINENCNIDFAKLSEITGKYTEPKPEFIVGGDTHQGYGPIDIANGQGSIKYGQPTSNFKPLIKPNARVFRPHPKVNVIQANPVNLSGPPGTRIWSGGNDATKAAIKDGPGQIGGYVNAPPFMAHSQNLMGPDTMDFNPMTAEIGYSPHNAVDVDGVELHRNPDAYSGRALVALTEAPTQSLYSWASKTYKKEGNIKRMVSTGYHKSDVWLSILFQIMAALYTLQIHNITFNDFKISDNVYIKDISDHDNVTRYWKYKIDGIDYYIPNYGYMALIDSNYKDVDKANFTISKAAGQKSQKNEKYKIYGDLFIQDGGGCKEDNTLINDMCFKAFKECFSINSFSNAFTAVGGVKPPDEALEIIKKVENRITQTGGGDTPSNKIGDYIHSCMGRFLNNRTGTYLKETEVANIRKDDHTELKAGRLVVHEIQHETFKFVTFKELKKEDKQLAIIFTKKDVGAQDVASNDIIESEVRLETLFNYSNYESIAQNYKPNESKLNDEELLETYVINGIKQTN